MVDGSKTANGVGTGRRTPEMTSIVARLQAAPRCQRRSKRTKLPCLAPAVRGYHVCRFHGARGGAPHGNRNAWKHGVRGAAWQRKAGELRDLVREARRLAAAAKTRVHGVVRSETQGDPPASPKTVSFGGVGEAGWHPTPQSPVVGMAQRLRL